MISTLAATRISTVARTAALAAIIGAAFAGTAGTALGWAGSANTEPAENAAPAGTPSVGRLYGDPLAAAPYWRPQTYNDCAEMAVADVTGQLTGHEPAEQDIVTIAENTPSNFHPGSIYHPGQPPGTNEGDVAVLLERYGIHSVTTRGSTTIEALERSRADGHQVIAGVNAETLWNKGNGDRTEQDHFVVVTGIDTNTGVVHLNDSGIKTGRDEQVSVATFIRAWAASHDEMTVTTK
jgi:Peptidase_C39 like family